MPIEINISGPRATSIFLTFSNLTSRAPYTLAAALALGSRALSFACIPVVPRINISSSGTTSIRLTLANLTSRAFHIFAAIVATVGTFPCTGVPGMFPRVRLRLDVSSSGTSSVFLTLLNRFSRALYTLAATLTVGSRESSTCVPRIGVLSQASQ